jgi:hypothetical protein
MLKLSPETQAYGIALSQQKKAEADERAVTSMASIIRVALLDMFAAGYKRCLADHDLDDEEVPDGVAIDAAAEGVIDEE